MDSIEAAKGPIAAFKRTKIIATIGPSTDSYESIYDLIKAGVNGIRLNFSHGTHEERIRQIPWIRKASRELGKPVAIIQDLQGPKIRLGDFEGVVDIQAGKEYGFEYLSNYEETGHLPTQYDLSKKVKSGERLYLFDGRVRLVITSVHGGVVHAKADNDGMVISRKGINLPDTDFAGDILTEKDMDDVAFGATQDFDYVALSFVQAASDVEHLRRILRARGSTAKIIVKLETKAGVENIEEIVKATDVIMVARGDLAVETPAETVPVVQRQIIGLGQQYSTPTIVATQMLLSMVDRPEPTRAEVSDVATAAFLGTDCVMLSDETAIGKYPIEAVRTMKRIVTYAEQNQPAKLTYPYEREKSIQDAISKSVITLAENVGAQAIVAATKSGVTARYISSLRPRISLMAVTDEERTAQQLAIVYGVKSYVRKAGEKATQRLTDWLRDKRLLRSKDIVVMVTGRYPGVIGTTDTIKVRMLE